MTQQTPEETILAALVAAAGAASLTEAELTRLGAAVRQVRDDARAVSALDLEGVEPESVPQVELP